MFDLRNRKPGSDGWKGLALTCLFSMTLMLRAQVADTYENSGLYNGPGAPINATNFINDSGASFDINFASLPAGNNKLLPNNLIGDLFDGWSYVQNYTNYGTMDCNTGFRFDTQSSGHVGALNFDNAGVISCGVDSNSLPIIQYYDLNKLSVVGYGGIYVLATNIVDSGSIVTGTSTLMSFEGQNIDLTGGTLDMSTNGGASFFNFGELGSGAYADFGLNTNFWNPYLNLTANDADTSLPFGYYLQNSTPYINVISNYNGSNTLVQAVFLVTEQTNVTASVYFFPSQLGNDYAVIQWSGSYLDPSSGQLSENYLALEDNYSLAVSTNVALTFNNVPDNFGFFSSFGTPLIIGSSAASGFPTGFSFEPDAGITNMYSDAIVDIQPTTVGTNLVPGGALTNIAGRVQLDASGTLNISGANISGMNYLSLRGTNQFVNDGLAHIFAPYTDMYLGCTNGNFVLTNVLISSVPNWSGSVVAWSSGWENPNGDGTTNIYEVLVVDASLYPKFDAQQQDVYLYASNNLTISDGLNIMRGFYTTATNILLTTNALGVGSEAVQGELNIEAPDFSWALATPYLNTLTNSGLIATPNLATFGSAAVPYLAFDNFGTVSNAGGTKIYSDVFENSGLITSGSGLFSVQAGTAILTNGTITSAASMTLTANSLIISNQNLNVGQGLTLAGTTLLTDTGATNGNNWIIGTNYSGFGSVAGISLLSKPMTGDLLGTTIIANSPGSVLNNTWAGIDYGLSNAGYTNNEAIGRLILDSTTNNLHFGKYTFTGASVGNAVYIDYLEFRDAATNGVNNSYDFTPWLSINTNITVYFAQATAMGVSIAEKINNASLAGKNNGGRLRWMPSYAGYFSSTNLLNPDGTTNTVNAALAASNLIDSNGNGIVNKLDPTPFYQAENVGLNVQVTNLPPLSALVSWNSIPGSTNTLYYRASLASTNWLVLTNFVSPSTVPPVGGWPITNLVTVPISGTQPNFYKVGVTPNNQMLYGN